MSASELLRDAHAVPLPVAESLFALSRDLLSVLTFEGDFARVSDSVRRLTGYPARALVGQPFLSFVHPLDRELVERAFRAVWECGHADDVPTRFRTFAGSHVSLRWTAVRDDDGARVLVIAREMRHERERTVRRRARAALKAAAAERARLRADLHDGLLQSLTGASLKLATALRQLESDPAAARHLLARVAALLQQEQRELRYLVEEMKEGWAARPAGEQPLEDRLTELARRLRTTWDIQLLSFVSGDGSLPKTLVRPVFGIVHEAVVNAARHGRATAATVQLKLAPDHVQLLVSDNGKGLSFSGKLDNEQLQTHKQGPLVLKHRVWSLGGTLSVESCPQGVSVAIRIPY